MSSTDEQAGLCRALAEARRGTGLDQVELARIAGVAQSVISAGETGVRRAPWVVVDTLCDELRELGRAEDAAHLRELRSRVEAPGLGEPGSLSLCVGGEDAHWVRRKPGQLFCEEDGDDLLGRCPRCEFEFRLASERARYCAGCGTPITALLESSGDPGFVEAVRRHRQEDQAAVIEGGGEHLVATPEPMTAPERVRRHNQEVGKTSLDDDTSREGRHYAIARELAESEGGGPFTRRMFVDRYLERFGGTENTVLPSEFRIGSRLRGRRPPWFLEKRARGRYAFVGLNGDGDGLRAAGRTADVEES